jgi:hypothetical protein
MRISINIIILAIIALGAMAYLYADRMKRTEYDAEMLKNLNAKFDEQNKKIEIQGKQLSDSLSSQATINYISSQSAIKRLFSKEARDQQEEYNKVLNSIPEVIKKELNKTGENIDNISHIGVQIDSLDVLVEIGKDANFKRGYLKLEKDSTGKEYYHLHLFSEEIEIVEVRTEPAEDGREYSYVTAKSKLTGQVYKTKQTVFPIVNNKSGFRISPWVELSITNNIRNSTASAGLISWRIGDTGSPFYSKYEINLGKLQVGFDDIKINILDFRINF